MADLMDLVGLRRAGRTQLPDCRSCLGSIQWTSGSARAVRLAGAVSVVAANRIACLVRMVPRLVLAAVAAGRGTIVDAMDRLDQLVVCGRAARFLRCPCHL